MHLLPSVAKQPNLELKTRPKQLLGYHPLVIALPVPFYIVSLPINCNSYLCKIKSKLNPCFMYTLYTLQLVQNKDRGSSLLKLSCQWIGPIFFNMSYVRLGRYLSNVWRHSMSMMTRPFFECHLLSKRMKVLSYKTLIMVNYIKLMRLSIQDISTLVYYLWVKWNSTIGATTPSITTLSIRSFYVTLSRSDSQH